MKEGFVMSDGIDGSREVREWRLDPRAMRPPNDPSDLPNNTFMKLFDNPKIGS